MVTGTIRDDLLTRREKHVFTKERSNVHHLNPETKLTAHLPSRLLKRGMVEVHRLVYMVPLAKEFHPNPRFTRNTETEEKVKLLKDRASDKPRTWDILYNTLA